MSHYPHLLEENLGLFHWSMLLIFIIACALVCSPFSWQTRPRVPSRAPALLADYPFSSPRRLTFLLAEVTCTLYSRGVWISAQYRMRSGYGSGICIHKWGGFIFVKSVLVLFFIYFLIKYIIYKYIYIYI
jgi:hypothetical protein